MTEEQIQLQWEQLIKYINTYIASPRREAVIQMYNKYADRVCTAPASSHATRHNCYPGGYIDHVNRVIKCALSLYDVWSANGANTSNYTKEELVFAALNHDLGKIGDEYNEYYIPNDSKWHVERGQTYKINPKLTFMKVPDRSIFLLQLNEISFSENEYLAIKLHDGLYAKGNESYLMAGQPEFALKTDMPILLHHADHMATLIEGNLTHQPKEEGTQRMKSKLTNVNNPIVDDSLKSAFDKLFGE